MGKPAVLYKLKTLNTNYLRIYVSQIQRQWGQGEGERTRSPYNNPRAVRAP